MIRYLKTAVDRRNRSRTVRNFRKTVALGTRARIVRPDETLSGKVLSVSASKRKAYVQADDYRFMGWVSTDALYPEEPAS